MNRKVFAEEHNKTALSFLKPEIVVQDHHYLKILPLSTAHTSSESTTKGNRCNPPPGDSYICGHLGAQFTTTHHSARTSPDIILSSRHQSVLCILMVGTYSVFCSGCPRVELCRGVWFTMGPAILSFPTICTQKVCQ